MTPRITISGKKIKNHCLQTKALIHTHINKFRHAQQKQMPLNSQTLEKLKIAQKSQNATTHQNMQISIKTQQNQLLI